MPPEATLLSHGVVASTQITLLATVHGTFDVSLVERLIGAALKWRGTYPGTDNFDGHLDAITALRETIDSLKKDMPPTAEEPIVGHENPEVAKMAQAWGVKL
jgi:hypothetical protein